MQVKSLLLLLLLCLRCTLAIAQQSYEWRATVPAPVQDGYHSILLPPEVSGRLRPDLADIRLYNAAQQEVPYLLRKKEESLTPIPVQHTTRTDSTSIKQTFINLQFAQPVYPERLVLNITAPALYLRDGYIITGKSTTTRKRRRRRRRSEVTPMRMPFTLSANEPARIELPRHQVQELAIVINNEDNPPLEIADITPLQHNRYLVANLEAGENHMLYFGDKDASAPEYDLKFFRDSIPTDLPVLVPTNINAVEERQQDAGQGTSRLLIWAAIGVVAAGLGYMSVRLLREMGNEKKQL